MLRSSCSLCGGNSSEPGIDKHLPVQCQLFVWLALFWLGYSCLFGSALKEKRDGSFLGFWLISRSFLFYSQSYTAAGPWRKWKKLTHHFNAMLNFQQSGGGAHLCIDFVVCLTKYRHVQRMIPALLEFSIMSAVPVKTYLCRTVGLGLFYTGRWKEV